MSLCLEEDAELVLVASGDIWMCEAALAHVAHDAHAGGEFCKGLHPKAGADCLNCSAELQRLRHAAVAVGGGSESGGGNVLRLQIAGRGGGGRCR